MTIAANIARVREQIAEACLRSNRPVEAVTLVAISKTHPPSAILEAVDAGLQHFGENRVEESQQKIPAVQEMVEVSLTWHMVGHVQSRKAKLVAPLFAVVHSVDSVKLAQKLASALPVGQQLEVLVEINVSGEASKQGLQAAAWRTDRALFDRIALTIETIAGCQGLNLCGLMTMAPMVEDAEQVRPVFASLRGLRDALSERTGLHLPHLSMGMTDDYPVAIEEGATMVRIGRAIFGERVMKSQ